MPEQHIKIREKRGTHRYFIDNQFLKEYGAELGPYAIAVYNVLVMRADFDTQSYETSYQTIADFTGMSRRQAIREIDKLIEYNIITKKVNSYTSENGKKTYTDPEFTLLHSDYWRKDSSLAMRTSDTQSLPSDSQSLEVVTHSHQPSDTQSLPPSDTQSLIDYKQEPIKQEPLQEPKQKDYSAKQKIMFALANACRIDLAIIADKTWGKLSQTAEKLEKANHTPGDIDRFKDWWFSNDWRGQKDQPPTPPQVLSSWGNYEHWLKNGKKANNNGQRHKAIDSDRQAEFDRAFEQAKQNKLGQLGG